MTTESMERDQWLWNRWRDGDREAARQLLSLYEGAIFGAMKRYGFRQREEQQEVYATLVLELSRYKEGAELRSSFFGLVRRILLSRSVANLRLASADLPDGDAVNTIPDPATRSPAESVGFREALSQCLERLRKPLEREVFCERYLSGKDNRSIAVDLGKTPNYIAVVLHGAVKQMRACLQGSGYS